MAQKQDIRKNNNLKIESLNLSVNQSSKLTSPSELLASLQTEKWCYYCISVFFSYLPKALFKQSSLRFRRVLQPLPLGVPASNYFQK